MAQGAAASKAKGKTGRKLTKKEKKLADLTARGHSGADAAMIAYETSNRDSARAIASEVLQKPDVRAYLESVAAEAAEIVMGHARDSKSDMVSLLAARDVLDRTGFKTPEPAKDPNQGATYNFIFSKQTQEEVKQIEDIIRARLTGQPHHAEATWKAVEPVEEGPEEAGTPA